MIQDIKAVGDGTVATWDIQTRLYTGDSSNSQIARSQSLQVDIAELDTDSDGVSDATDNCPNDANVDQSDVNFNGIGDACDDSDTDGDGVLDADEYSAGMDPSRVRVLPMGYVFPEHIVPLLLAPLDDAVDGQRPLSH